MTNNKSFIRTYKNLCNTCHKKELGLVSYSFFIYMPFSMFPSPSYVHLNFPLTDSCRVFILLLLCCLLYVCINLY